MYVIFIHICKPMTDNSNNEDFFLVEIRADFFCYSFLCFSGKDAALGLAMATLLYILPLTQDLC